MSAARPLFLRCFSSPIQSERRIHWPLHGDCRAARRSSIATSARRNARKLHEIWRPLPEAAASYCSSPPTQPWRNASVLTASTGRKRGCPAPEAPAWSPPRPTMPTRSLVLQISGWTPASWPRCCPPTAAPATLRSGSSAPANWRSAARYLSLRWAASLRTRQNVSRGEALQAVLVWKRSLRSGTRTRCGRRRAARRCAQPGPKPQDALRTRG